MVQFLDKCFSSWNKIKMAKNKRKTEESQHRKKLMKINNPSQIKTKPIAQTKEENNGEDENNEIEDLTLRNDYRNISLDDLKVIATLGKGGFARVDLVKDINKPSSTFAMKRVKKQYVVETKEQQHMINERNLMLSCNNQFICRMYKTFRDDKYIYMLLEACLGGEVWTILRDKKFFDEYTTKFIIACVIEAFQYLHPKGIIYRDLKPENLLLDSRGYVKLVDFGFAKNVGVLKKTYSFCGTPAYIAPEIIRKKGHNKAVDYWALGILTHELLTGDVPFSDPDITRTFLTILKGFDRFHFRNINSLPRNFIEQLCRIVPTERLGCQSKEFEDIRNHEWFRGFEWKNLIAGTLPAPIKNSVKNSHDTSNFDQFNEVEEESPQDEFSGWDASF